jgi:hypothetical protein
MDVNGEGFSAISGLIIDCCGEKGDFGSLESWKKDYYLKMVVEKPKYRHFFNHDCRI